MKPGKIIILLLIVFFYTVSLFSQSRIYVDIDALGSADGSTWADAYTDLQDAIDVSVAGDSIWIAEGLYRPTKDLNGNAIPTDLRSKTFYVDQDIKIFGGFDATETSFSNRNLQNNLSILSGNIGDEMTSADNAYHVMIIKGTTSNPISLDCEINGLVIEDGNANAANLTAIDAGGGGILARGGGASGLSSPTISNCPFRSNYGNSGGAAFRADGTSNGTSEPVLSNCIFENNTSNSQGAGIDVFGGFRLSGNTHVGIINCLFYDNQSTFGSVISLDGFGGSASATITNTTIADNTGFALQGSSSGGGSASIIFNNSIAHGNTAFSSFVSLSYSQTTSITNEDPLFIDRAAKNYRLLPCSPGIDTRTDGLNMTASDIEGGTRIQGTSIDIGAYESAPLTGPGNVVYVSTLANECEDATSWASAFTDLQEALNTVQDNQVIWIAEGIYKPAYDSLGNDMPTDPREKTFYITKDIKIYGGFAGNETQLSERDIQVNETILSGVIGNTGTEADSVYHESKPVFVNCLFKSNVSPSALGGNKGGAMYNFGNEGEASPTVTNCNFISNSATNGGAMYNASFSTISIGSADIVINNSIFSVNQSGISNNGGATTTINNSIIPVLSSGTNGSNNLVGANPLFVTSSDYNLQSGSPAINAGLNGVNAESIDFEGKDRIINNFIDIGMMENQDLCAPIVPNVVYVDAAASGTNDGTCWRNAYNNLNDALNATFEKPQKEIWVARGSYMNINVGFRLQPGVAMYGSFMGGEIRKNQRVSASTENEWTILEGSDGNASTGVVFASISGTSQDTLDGFWIQNGDRGVLLGSLAGGSFTMNNCVIKGNRLQGGFSIENCIGSQIEITNTKFIDNNAQVGGGALSVRVMGASGSVKIKNCEFTNNSNIWQGIQSFPIALMNWENATVDIESSIFNCNTIYNSFNGGSSESDFATPILNLRDVEMNLNACPGLDYPAIYVKRGMVTMHGQQTINE